MKHVLLIFFIMSFLAHAGTVSFTKPCSNEIIHRYSKVSSERMSVAEFTLAALKFLNISHQGSLEGISSIYKTPTGLEAMDVINDHELRAYGWCYSINGYSPEVLPGEMAVENDDKVLWWYGYAQYLNGEWITQCTPSYSQRDSNFCKKLAL